MPENDFASQELDDAQDLSDLEDADDLEDFEDLEDIEDLEEVPDIEDLEDAEDFEDFEDLDDPGDFEGLEDLEDLDDLDDLEDIEDLSDLDDGDDDGNWTASFDGCGSCEEEEVPPTLIERTSTGGWAAKWKPGEFDTITRGFVPAFSQEGKVGFVDGDDCIVVRINDQQATVFNLDWVPPMVNDPYAFGGIAAANALGGLYATGAKPLTALNVMALPCKMGVDEVGEVMRGGSDKVVEAGAFVVGGHSIDDNDPKYGLATFGVAHPDDIMRNENARPGDLLFYTKPVGTGIMIDALQAGAETDDGMREATDSMLELNKAAAEAMTEAGAHAAVYVTGYGLVGHLHRLLESCGASATIRWDDIPLLDGAWQHCRDGFRSQRTEDTMTWAGQFVDQSALPQEDAENRMAILCDTQTSGGLIVAVPEERADDFAAAFDRSAGHPAARIGQITEGEIGIVTVI